MDAGYPTYSRPDYGIVFFKHRSGSGPSFQVMNQWVVPHNHYLLTKYQAHLNVEICATIDALGYLYKYVFKESDRESFAVNVQDEV